MAETPLAHTHDVGITLVLEDLVRESLRTLLVVSVALSWLWLAQVIVADRPYLVWAYVVLATLTAAAALSHRLSRRHLGLAVAAYLAGLTLAVTVIASALQGAAVSYLYLLIVLVAAVLTDQRGMWSVTLACIGLVVLAGTRAHHASLSDLFPVALCILLAALTAWLSSRRLFTALSWALSMTEQAQRNARDARERRAEVRSMLKSLDEAYVRLERANEALIFAREAAEKAYRFKAEFVANVSHELRTPLNLIVGFSEMMATAPESYRGRRLPSEYRGDVMAIYHSARHLSDLIDDVLDLSQIEAGRLPISREAADLGGIVREAVDIIRGLAQAKGLRLELDLPPDLPTLRLDRTRIRQVLLNVLSNATRFTDQGWIRVRASVQGRQVHVTVEDSGRGIAPDKLAQAFEAFGQLHEDRARQGSGLGLAVSRRFVELHGGTMWIESTLGQGTTVGFTLPVDEGEAAPRPLIRSRKVPRSGDGRPRVLVLHDDPHVLTLLRRYVEGIHFVLAETGERAVELLRHTPPFAVVMDRGWGERWRDLLAEAGLTEPLPALTCPLPSLRQLALLLGAADYLVKPVRREALLQSLARLPKPPHSVLVVDDDPSFARLMIRIIKAHDPQVNLLMASGGAEGLAIARSERPDLVLLDLLMPEVSGYDFLEEVRRDPALAGMTVIILSARSLEQEARPVAGELRLERPDGLTPTETLQAIQALLAVLTQPAAASRASVAAPGAGRPG
ncbi:MAG: ATP-binding protein [Anaerolineae bacterium]|nr:ATP-binding protein [Anaerolineae bacterium]